MLRSPKFYGGKWISGQNVHKSADFWDTQFFLFSQKFHNQSFFPNCKKTEPGTTFLKISLDLAYSIDSKEGLTFENPKFNSWLISKTVLNQNAPTVFNFRSLFQNPYSQNFDIESKKSRKNKKKIRKFLATPEFELQSPGWAAAFLTTRL